MIREFLCRHDHHKWSGIINSFEDERWQERIGYKEFWMREFEGWTYYTTFKRCLVCGEERSCDFDGTFYEKSSRKILFKDPEERQKRKTALLAAINKIQRKIVFATLYLPNGKERARLFMEELKVLEEGLREIAEERI